jgi:hypothetical protein
MRVKRVIALEIPKAIRRVRAHQRLAVAGSWTRACRPLASLLTRLPAWKRQMTDCCASRQGRRPTIR